MPVDIAPFQARRARLLQTMQEAGGGVAIIPTAPERVRNRDTHHSYRFDSYFWYLSGFPEPEAVLVLDATAGKSVNAIRSFVGKGTLVWGARTLAGNDNEWRYISVRRFFNMVEESVKKSTYWAVFEPNDANTWVKVRGMIESYLTQKWREGALAGSTTKDAFFVRCGLGTTMSSQDILEGRMYVEIGMAVVRPAEFIILKFYHKLQTS